MPIMSYLQSSNDHVISATNALDFNVPNGKIFTLTWDAGSDCSWLVSFFGKTSSVSYQAVQVHNTNTLTGNIIATVPSNATSNPIATGDKNITSRIYKLTSRVDNLHVSIIPLHGASHMHFSVS